ncbi:unnamed protein product, partial [Aphanomyces euteiches]
MVEETQTGLWFCVAGFEFGSPITSRGWDQGLPRRNANLQFALYSRRCLAPMVSTTSLLAAAIAVTAVHAKITAKLTHAIEAGNTPDVVIVEFNSIDAALEKADVHIEKVQTRSEKIQTVLGALQDHAKTDQAAALDVITKSQSAEELNDGFSYESYAISNIIALNKPSAALLEKLKTVANVKSIRHQYMGRIPLCLRRCAVLTLQRRLRPHEKPAHDGVLRHVLEPSLAIWDVSLYTGYNTTAAENEVLMRRLVDRIDALPLGSSQLIEVPVQEIPFTIVLTKTALFLQGVSKSNQKLDLNSGRYSLMIVKLFSISNPVFDPLESLVVLVKIENKVHGFKSLRVLKTINGNETHQSMVDATKSYPGLVGLVQHQMCVSYNDMGASKCGSIILPPGVAASLVVDPLKTKDKTTTMPSCKHPDIIGMVYSIMDVDKANYYCASDPTSIGDLLAFENCTGNFAPTGFRLQGSGVGFLDGAPNATSLMLPLVQLTTRRWSGSVSRVDYIIQTQLLILLTSRVATAIIYIVLLAKTSWTARRSLFILLVENFTLEVTNNSSLDTTAALTLAVTFWTYQDIIVTMIVRQCIQPLPWNSASSHSYTDDLIFIPGPVCYVFVVSLCAMKHVLHSLRICVRLVYAAVYLASVILVAGALTNQGPAFTSVKSVEPYALYPTLFAPMVWYFYRTSPHLDSYFYMAVVKLPA